VCLSDKHQPDSHQYGYTYNALFWRCKYRLIKLLEIGIGGYDKRLGGESLNAWQAFFPFGKIIGCDIRDRTSLSNIRTKIYVLDQSSKIQLQNLLYNEGMFDIIIDDGSHINAHQIFTFKTLYPSVKQGGVYIIEDVQTSYWSDGGWDGVAINDCKFDDTCVGFFLRLAKYINYQEFRDFGGVDEEMVHIARSLKQVIFEHNLIIVIKA
jgi:demethylmacrocin O-methyltransferase